MCECLGWVHGGLWRVDPVARWFIQHARQRKAGDGGVLPGDHDLRRRDAEDRQRDIARRPVRLERHDCAYRSGKRLRGRAEQAFTRDMQLPYAALDELPLRRTRTQDNRASAGLHNPLQQHEAILALPLIASKPIGDDQDGRPGRGRYVGRAR